MNATDPGHQAIIDAEHLRLLGIFHFVSAALAFVGVLFATLYFVLISAVFANPEMWAQSQEGPPPEAFIAAAQDGDVSTLEQFFASDVVACSTEAAHPAQLQHDASQKTFASGQ